MRAVEVLHRPLLTISIPTYNRARYLAILLEQMRKEIVALATSDTVEVLVSDNASLDNTAQVVQQVREAGLKLRYLRNVENLGSDRNIAQAFNEASGRYVLIMGDDDVLVDGILAMLMDKLTQSASGVLLLRAYGYENDFRSELPKLHKGWSEYNSPGQFLQRAGAQITLISACVINKEIIEPLDANYFIGENLVQVHLLLNALLASKKAIIYDGYAVACKRNNSGGYLYADVFVKNLGSVLDSYVGNNLTNKDISVFENKLLRIHHPYYVWRSLRQEDEFLSLSKKSFDDRFHGNMNYILFVRPILALPKALAWLWGVISIGIGRGLLGGDLLRGLYFISNKLKMFFKSVCKKNSGLGDIPPC